MRTFAVVSCVLAAGCLDVQEPALGAHQRAATPTPGSYGPEFAEPGYTAKNSYFAAGFQATVNHYGGNLMVAATDVDIASQGLHGLFFRRTYNSNSVQLQSMTVLGESDSPLGDGWTSHYGVLWTSAPGVFRPQFIDNTGARHLFYPHTVLTSVLGITSPGSNPTYISPRLEILRWIDAEHWELLTPGGLRYELEKLPQYGFLVPTRIRDVHGNTWTITYEPDANVYVQHPLPSKIRDGLGRELVFSYVTRSGKKRLQSVRFDGRTLAEYSYVTHGVHEFLWKHTTGEGRVTEYTTDTGPYPRLGTITAIEAPTGGVTEIDYDLKSIFYKVGQPQQVYAVTEIRRGGHTWRYDYLNATGSAPAGNEFRVRVTTTDFQGTYTYYTYGSSVVCGGNLWKVGMLLHSEETYLGTTRRQSYAYDRFHVANATGADLCDVTVAAAQLREETTEQDGYAMATTYSDHDALNFPRRIDRPGAVREDLGYHHLVAGGSAPRLLLGQASSTEVRHGGALVGKTTFSFGSSSAVPSSARFYRTTTAYVDTALDHYTTDGKAGALRSKRYGGYTETYDYQNGVLSSVSYPTGPGLSRAIDDDGTIAAETRNGVRRGFRWDDDFRLVHVDNPGSDADTSIAYTATQATITSGPAQEIRIYDAWGRLTERREKIAGGQFAIDRFASFDAFDRARREITRAGATYDLVHDVYGRVVERIAPDDERVYRYRTDADGVHVTETLNGAVTFERSTDHRGRMTRGATDGHEVTYQYAIASGGVTQTIRPQGLPARTVVRDLLGATLSETHPETGAIAYDYSPEGWLREVDRPGIDYTFTVDGRGRPTQVKVGGRVIATRRYHATYGTVDRTEHDGVIVEHRDFDASGRPRTISHTIPRPLSPPRMRFPLTFQPHLPGPGKSGYLPYFYWEPADGAASYDWELWERDIATDKVTLIHRGSQASWKLPWSSIPFSPTVSPWVSYVFRVRSRSASGELSAYGPSSHFNVGSPMAPIGATPELPGDDMPPPPPAWEELPEIYPRPMKEPVVLVTRLEYDSLGRIAALRHPDLDVCRGGSKRNREQTFTYNALGGPDRVRLDGNDVVSGTSYWDSGLPRVATAPVRRVDFSGPASATYVRQQFDHLGRLVDHKVDDGERALYWARDLRYEPRGYLESLRRADPGLSSAVSYDYDDHGRLRTYSVGGSSVAYSYDAASNLRAHGALSVAGLTAYGTGLAPRPASLELPALGPVSYDSANRRAAWTYDADGRVVADDDWRYDYDALDQVTAVWDGAWPVAQYRNDADGNRVREVTGAVVTYTVRLPDGRAITFEKQRFVSRQMAGDEVLLCSPSMALDLVYHGAQPILEARHHDYSWVWESDLEYQFRDRLGNPALVMSTVDSKDLNRKYYEYAPYGQQIRTEIWNRYVSAEYTGHERDAVTGRDYMRARYYDPVLARFNRPDPAFDFDPMEPASFNLYAYTRGNPINFVDPTGRNPEGGGQTLTTTTSTTACPVQLCQRPADLPGGDLMNRLFGLRHWWIKTPNKEAGMGKLGGGVPGLAETDDPYTLYTSLNDHTGQSEDPASTCAPVCGVDVDKVEELLEVGRETGPWLPLVSDCNNVCDDILRDAGGDPKNWQDPPLHSRLLHDIVTLRFVTPAMTRPFAVFTFRGAHWRPFMRPTVTIEPPVPARR